MHATGGMAATSNPLSTMAAIDMLRSGGNAVDAAVTACAVQCVVEPESTGIGGDCFVLFAPRGGTDIVAYNGSGRAPMAATAEWFAANGIDRIQRTTPHAVTVPGAVDAWARLVADHGRKSLGEVLEPAIRYARDGYPIHSRVSEDFASQVEILRRDPTAERIFLPGGEPPKPGQLHHQSELAATLERVAEHGRDGFYKGPVAEDIVTYLRSLGGLHAMEDFETAEGEYVEPIKTVYRGYEVYECPPNGQGITALIMLNILSGFDLSALDPLSAERLHLEIEAARLAYRDRDSFLADPAMVAVPVAELLSEKHAQRLRAAIRRDRAMQALPPNHMTAGSDTVYLCVVDSDRNAVSFINSLFNPFGSGLVSPRTGVSLQNRGCGFVLDPEHANCIAPGKRPFHTIIPGMLVEDGRTVMPFGVMGGQYQAVGHAHLLTNHLDLGLDLQESLDLPRVFPNADGVVEVESGIPAEAVAGLQRLGHRTAPTERPHGGGQAIRIDWEEGVLTGGSDPRKDGCAIGY